MNKQHLIVAVKEGAYLDRLAEYIRHSAYGQQWQLTAFTNVQALRQYLKSGYPADLLAVQPIMAAEIREAAGSTPMAVLITGPERAAIGHEVLQFQPLPSLLLALTAVYAAGTSAPVSLGTRSGRRGVIAAVGSAISGIGKTTFALRLAQQAGTRGANVFYLNLEQWNASEIWFGAEDGGDHLSQLLYTLQADPDKAIQRLQQLKRRHPVLKVDYLPPPLHAEERLSMKADIAERLIGAVASSNQYDLIVIDTDGRFDDVLQAVVDRTDVLLWLVAGDAVSRVKHRIAMQYAKQQWGERFEQSKSKFRYFAVDCTRSVQAAPFEVRIDGTLPALAGAGSDAHYRSCVDGILDRLQLLGGGGVSAGRDHSSA